MDAGLAVDQSSFGARRVRFLPPVPLLAVDLNLYVGDTFELDGEFALQAFNLGFDLGESYRCGSFDVVRAERRRDR